MAENYQATYDKLCAHAREVALLTSTQSLLGWDERTKLPPAGGDYRAQQMSYLAGAIHKLQTAPQVGEWLSELVDSTLTADPHSESGADILNMRRDYDRKTKLPQALVEEIAKLSVLGQQLWVEARKANDFPKFRPLLERMVELKRQEAAAIGYEKEPYDALLDEYEPGAKTKEVAAALSGLRDQLVPLVAEIDASSRRPNLEVLKGNYPVDRQEQFGKVSIESIGFDFKKGRLDVTDHPFCGGAGPQDVRLTTRYDDTLSGALFSTLHEAGHGIYEQGLPADRYGLPTGEAVSLGIHESQSRMWENFVGRSRPYWEYFFPQAQKTFPDSLGRAALDDFYFAINDVRPSLIRTESDEVTYNLHILIRFELELALMNDQLRVADLPAAWNAKYREYLGIESPTDSGRAAGRALERRRHRLLPDVLAWEPVRRAAVRSGGPRPGRLARDVPQRRILAAARLAAQAYPLAWPPLPGRRAGPPCHRRAALARRLAAPFARQIRTAVCIGLVAAVSPKPRLRVGSTCQVRRRKCLTK
jgi:carboxypeptidase Taq